MSSLQSWEHGLGLAGSQNRLLQVAVHAAQRYVRNTSGEMIPAGRSLFGERLEYLGVDTTRLIHVRTCLDGYESYVCADDVVPAGHPPTHYICVPHTNAREEPCAQAKRHLYLGAMSPVCVVGSAAAFVAVTGAGWVPREHVRPIGDYATDYVTQAERFLETPYDWGGRDGLGIDCSALVQTAFALTGVKVQRTAGEQCATIGTLLTTGRALATMQRGDLVFWGAHVGIMLDAARILHACEYLGGVGIELLATVMTRRMHEEPPEKRDILAIRRP